MRCKVGCGPHYGEIQSSIDYPPYFALLQCRSTVGPGSGSGSTRVRSKVLRGCAATGVLGASSAGCCSVLVKNLSNASVGEATGITHRCTNRSQQCAQRQQAYGEREREVMLLWIPLRRTPELNRPVVFDVHFCSTALTFGNTLSTTPQLSVPTLPCRFRVTDYFGHRIPTRNCCAADGNVNVNRLCLRCPAAQTGGVTPTLYSFDSPDNQRIRKGNAWTLHSPCPSCRTAGLPPNLVPGHAGVRCPRKIHGAPVPKITSTTTPRPSVLGAETGKEPRRLNSLEGGGNTGDACASRVRVELGGGSDR